MPVLDVRFYTNQLINLAVGDPTAWALFSPVESMKPKNGPARSQVYDLVASPDPISQIRRIRMCKPLDESRAELVWRQRREAVVEWHHRFWTDNNLDFARCKETWQAAWVEAKGTEPTSSDMSIFYKEYLDQAKDRHMEYNHRWWRENFAMLVPGFRGEWKRLQRWISSPTFAMPSVEVVKSRKDS